MDRPKMKSYLLLRAIIAEGSLFELLELWKLEGNEIKLLEMNALHF